MASLGKNRGFLHIKRRTEGTSNELSFSVLDAKSNTPGPVSTSPRTVTELGKVSLFTVPGGQGKEGAGAHGFGMSKGKKSQATLAVGGPGLLSFQTEVVQRKRHRRLVRVAQVLGVLALVGVLVVAGSQYFGSVVERQQVSHASLESAIDLLAQTDETVLALDSAIAQPAQSSNSVLKERLSGLAAAASLLDRAANDAEVALSQETDPVHVEAAQEVKKAAAARKDLLEAGKTLLTQSATAKRSADLAEQAWEAVLAADALTRQSAAALEGDDPSIEKSAELSEQAVAGFQEALVLVRRAAEAYEEADFSQLEEYLELRSSAQQNALAADAAAQGGMDDLENVNAQAYNEAEQQAAHLAESLPANPTQPVIDAFGRSGAQADAAYQQARARAAQADAALRAYREQAAE